MDGVTTEALQTTPSSPSIPRVATLLPTLAVPSRRGRELHPDQVSTVMASDQFAQLWAEANRAAHDQW